LSLPQGHLVKGLGWIALAIVCWAPLFPTAKRALPFVDAFALGTLRYAIGTVLFIALLIAFEGRRALRYDGRFASLLRRYSASSASPASTPSSGTGSPTRAPSTAPSS